MQAFSKEFIRDKARELKNLNVLQLWYLHVFANDSTLAQTLNKGFSSGTLNLPEIQKFMDNNPIEAKEWMHLVLRELEIKTDALRNSTQEQSGKWAQLANLKVWELEFLMNLHFRCEVISGRSDNLRNICSFLEIPLGTDFIPSEPPWLGEALSWFDVKFIDS